MSTSVADRLPSPGALVAANLPMKPEPVPTSMRLEKLMPPVSNSMDKPWHTSIVSMLGCMNLPPKGREKQIPTPL